MKRGEHTPRWCAKLALAFCLVKGLMTAVLFALLSSTPAIHHQPHPEFAKIEILSGAQRTEMLRAAFFPASSAKSAVKPPAPPASKAVPHAAALGGSCPEDDSALRAYLTFCESAEEKPLLARAPVNARAPPQLRHGPPPPYVFYPRPAIGLLSAWATPPPSV